MRCSSSCMDLFVPDPEKIAHVEAGTSYSSSDSSIGCVLETAIKYLHSSASPQALTLEAPSAADSSSLPVSAPYRRSLLSPTSVERLQSSFQFLCVKAAILRRCEKPPFFNAIFHLFCSFDCDFKADRRIRLYRTSASAHGRRRRPMNTLKRSVESCRRRITIFQGNIYDLFITVIQ